MTKRRIDLLVLSDIHLGTYGCHSKELLTYLNSIEPQRVVLNGDIIDIWQFKKRFWPKSHMQVVRHILGWIQEGVKVDYITGNHDEMMRRFAGFNLGSFSIQNKLLLNLSDEECWIFHGDVFDITMEHSKWLCRMGAVGYDLLIALNRLTNWSLKKMGRGRISLSKKIKGSVKSAVKFISDFEKTAAEIGIENGYQNVICGHIHAPQDRMYQTNKGQIRYLNSGDWVENCTALEYNRGAWSIYEYFEDENLKSQAHDRVEADFLNTHELFDLMVKEFVPSSSTDRL